MRIACARPQDLHTLLKNGIPVVNPALLAHFHQVCAFAVCADGFPIIHPPRASRVIEHRWITTLLSRQNTVSPIPIGKELRGMSDPEVETLRVIADAHFEGREDLK